MHQSPPTGEHIQAPDPNFDFAALLKARLDESGEQWEIDDLFSLSPLTSPESTPPPSPKPHPQTLPTVEDFESPRPQESSPTTLHDAEAERSQKRGRSHAVSPHSGRPTSPSPVGKKKKMKKASHENRRKKREQARETKFGGPSAREAAHAKYVANADTFFTQFNSVKAKVVRTGYSAMDDRIRDRRIYTLEELVGEESTWKFTLKKWDGRTPIAIVDKNGYLVAILAGHPDDPGWPTLHFQAAELLEEARQLCGKEKLGSHRRGNFQTMRCGFSHGGGQKHPKNLSNSVRFQKILDSLNNHGPFKRLAGFATSILATWAPKLHAHYVEKIGSLFTHDPNLMQTFNTSVFASTTYNLGPRTCCLPHKDFANLAYGLCSITALGDFDYEKGGHLVLWECGLVIEFPPSSTIMVTSAIVTHSNTPVSSHEKRYSFTQYTAGGLFRWVDHGFQKVNTYRASLTPDELVELDVKNENRWLMGLSLLPRFSFSSGA